MHGKALLVVHQRTSYPGRVGQILMERGYCLDIRCPNMGHALPRDVSDYAVVVVFGGPMSANDCHMPGIRRELDWIPEVLDSPTPLIGICLGAQMLARVLGAEICCHPEGMVEIGYTRVSPTEPGRRFFDGPMHVYQWHREGFSLPCGATLLARGETFENQAFQYGERAFGVQFHPEVTLGMKRRWTTHGAHRLTAPGAQPAALHLEQHDIHDPPLDAWIRRFLDGLLGPVGDRRAVAV